MQPQCFYHAVPNGNLFLNLIKWTLKKISESLQYILYGHYVIIVGNGRGESSVSIEGPRPVLISQWNHLLSSRRLTQVFDSALSTTSSPLLPPLPSHASPVLPSTLSPLPTPPLLNPLPIRAPRSAHLALVAWSRLCCRPTTTTITNSSGSTPLSPRSRQYHNRY